MSPSLLRRSLLIVWTSVLFVASMAEAQGVSVSLNVSVRSSKSSGTRSSHAGMAMNKTVSTGSVVAWLVPTGAAASSPARSPAFARSFVLAQKDKQFSPHLLVVPTGSAVEFPNLDPFFHNVFSLYNGRRFDLGLYEAGNRRSVRFDHDGVSYIFCNIHPEMGAVVVSLSTPFYAQSDKDGLITLLNVPAGEYELHLWSENVSPADVAAATEKIHVTSQPLHLPTITLQESRSSLDQHLNKFGKPYRKDDQVPY